MKRIICCKIPHKITPPANQAIDTSQLIVKEDTALATEEENLPNPDTEGQVFIYHSHNRESWLPELKGVKNPDMAYDSEKNVTLLGHRLEKILQDDGIGTVHSSVDYPSEIKSFRYAKSYEYSKNSVQTAQKKYPHVQYWFDIHRDSQRRSKTTVNIQGIDYAQIYFVVGEKNPNWRENFEFASRLHSILNQKYPGISKGVYKKNQEGSNSEYNQSHSKNSSLIEIGGVDNTLQEAYRTTEILAEAIRKLIQEQQPTLAQNNP